MDKKFEIYNINNCVIIRKEDSEICIEKRCDGDIWFHSPKGNEELNIAFHSRREPEEEDCYTIFKSLMKSIFGRYVLNDDYKDEYSYLPKDFIDLDNKVMTWHSDTIAENTLKIQYDSQVITISLIRTDNKDYDSPIRVRVRTSGSSYGHYFEEFEIFFREITRFSEKNKTQEEANQRSDTYVEQSTSNSESKEEKSILRKTIKQLFNRK